MIAGDSTNFSNFSIGGRGYIFWEELNVGTVPMFKTHNIGTVPTFQSGLRNTDGLLSSPQLGYFILG